MGKWPEKPAEQLTDEELADVIEANQDDPDPVVRDIVGGYVREWERRRGLPEAPLPADPAGVEGDEEENELALLTADVVCLRGDHVLTVERRWEPHIGEDALPGGCLKPGETFRDAAARELGEETGVAVRPEDLVEVGYYGDPGRDPRGRVLTVAYVVRVPDDTEARAGDDAAAVHWVPVAELADRPIAFDHGTIIAEALLLAR
ncbi:NUDIX hydrolase [Kitasatospora sp. NPDC004723]|uniref:NUDIX hydrolase n=1 Tax=Kitasatospora sp. NPDC004723 TaxID=3154288 RepID=UPI0033B1A1A1